ncbi:acetylcholine receptor DES-2-like protein [Aphelenchoides avenae]|nr:acetylcholine receptor DES-2-like protein [Aphelenchus avenae]
MEQDAGVPVDAAFAGSKRPQSPNGGEPSPRGPAPQGRSTSLQLAFHDDETSNPDSQNSSRQPTVRSQRIGKDNMLQHLGVFNENLRLSRQLAQKEYEWLATVMERCCFALFVLMFFGLTIGINLLGYYHWMDVGRFVNVAEDE